jgi:hypothetical protein
MRASRSRDTARRETGVFPNAPKKSRFVPDWARDGPGSEPEIYFNADRRSSTGYMYTDALMESQPYARTMQEEMIQEIESAHSTSVVFVRIGLSWLPRPGFDQTILQWASRYTQACFGLVGIADIHAPDSTKYAWEDGVMGYRPASQELIYTFRRTGDAPCAVSRR